MDVYHVWCDLKPGTSDLEFARDVQTYLSSLQEVRNLSFALYRDFPDPQRERGAEKF